MHIAHFSNYYLPVINGVVRSISGFRKSLIDLGHTVFVFAQGAPDYEDQEAFIFRYPMIKLPLQVEVPTAIPISPFVDRLLPPLKLDVIHTHHPFLLGQVAAEKSKELDVPLVFTFHTRYRDYTHYFPIPQEIVQDFVKTAIHTWLADFIQRCNHVVVPSESMREVLVAEYGIENKLTAIPTGIDLHPYLGVDRDAMRSELGWESDFVLISAGRLVPEKNWKTLVQAAGKAYQEIPNLRLVILGDGPGKKDLRKLADQLGLGTRLELPGSVPFDRIPGYLKAADLFGFASITETQGLVTMEGLAAGLPAVAVNATGTKDVIQVGTDGAVGGGCHDRPGSLNGGQQRRIPGYRR